MKTRNASLLILIASASCLAGPLNYLDNFSDGTRDPLFTVERTDSRYDYSEGEGALILSKQPNVTTQGITYRSMFALLGDFTAQVDCIRLTGNASVGIRARTTNGFVSLYYTTERGNRVYGAWALGEASGSGGQASPPAKSPFRLRRENGNRIVAEYTFGNSGWDRLTLHDGLTGPVTIELFMIEESGSNTSSSGKFDNLAILSPDFIDLRTTGTNTPTISRAVRIEWPTEINEVVPKIRTRR